MFELTAAVGDLSTQVKVGWTLWFVWGVLLLGWYRHAHSVSSVASAAPSRSTPVSAESVSGPCEDDPIYSDPSGSSATAR